MKRTLIKLIVLTWALTCQAFQLVGQDDALKKPLTVDSLRKLGQFYDRASLPDSSIFFYELAAKQLLKEADTTAYLSTKVTIADVYATIPRFDKAYKLLDSITQAEAGKQDSKPRFEAVNIKSYWLLAQRNFDQAFLYLDSAKRFNYQKQTKEGKMRQARISLFEAFANLQLNRLTVAEGLFETSRHIYDSLQMDFELAEVLNHYGALKVSLFKADEAMAYFKRAKETYESRADTSPSMVASLYTSIAQAYASLGLIPNAITSFEKADVLLKSLDPNHKDLAVVNTELANAYTQLGEFEKALVAIEKGLSLSKLYFGEASLWTLRAQYNLGRILRELSQHDKAISVFSEGIAVLKGDPSNDFIDMLALYTYEHGAAYFDSGKEEEGLRLVKNSIPISLGSGTNFERSPIGIYQGLAELYLQLNEPDSAVSYFQQALSMSSKKRGNSAANAQKVYHEKIYQSLMGKVVAFEMKYTSNNKRQWLDSAYQMLVAAEEKMGSFREFPNDLAQKLEIGSSISNSLHAGLKVCYQLYMLTGEKRYADHAYQLIEQSKSNQALFDSPLELQAPINVPDSVILKEKNINASISSLETLQYQERNAEESDDSKVKEYGQDIIRFTDELILLRSEISKKYPAYFQFKYNRELMSIEQTQSQLLTGDDVLINYYSQQDELYAFQIRKTDFSFIKIEVKNNLKTSIQRFNQMLKQPEINQKSVEDYVKLSSDLFNILLPGSDSFKPGGSIIIIPDGPLHYLPFQALTTNSEAGIVNNFKTLDYLMKSHPVRYATSSTMLSYHTRGKRQGKGAIAFAPSFVESDSDEPIQFDSVRASLGNLAYTNREVKNLGEHFNTNYFLDTAATEKAFRNSVKGYSIVHLASHGIIDPNNGFFSKLLFSPFDTDSINDGYLNTREILGMSIPADMVVLSACNTGSGELLAGEGVMSLANGFFYAGAKSVVMTLWTANDESTANIMGGFYENLANGQSKSQALRAAKFDYLENANSLSSHPYYWAHFVVNGDDRPLVKTGWSKVWWFLLLIPIAFFLISKFRKQLAD